MQKPRVENISGREGEVSEELLNAAEGKETGKCPPQLTISFCLSGVGTDAKCH